MAYRRNHKMSTEGGTEVKFSRQHRRQDQVSRGREHTTSPRPAPMMAEVGVSISGMPGPPCGPSYRMMMTCKGQDRRRIKSD